MLITYDGPDARPITVDLDEDAAEALRAIAERNNLTLEQAVVQAAVNEKLIEDLVDSGGQLLVKKGDELRYLDYA